MKKIKFIKNNNLVLSTEFSTPWTIARGIGRISNGFHIKSKSSLKGYIGVNKTVEKKVIIKNIYFWDSISKDYEINNFDYEVIEKLEKFIFGKLVENNINYGLEINFLSEVPRGHGLGFSGVFSSLISTVFHIFTKKLKIEELDKISKLDFFDEIFNFSLSLEKILRYNKTIGLNGLISFLNTKNPILVFENNGKIEYKKIGEKDSILALDYYIIFSGIPTKTKRIEKKLEKGNKISNELSDFLNNQINNLNIKNHYLKKFIDKEKINKNFEDTFHILNIKLLQNIGKLLEDFYDDLDINNFIENINGYRQLESLGGEYSDFLNIFEKSFYKNKKSLNNNIGIMPIYGGKTGGGYLVVSKENTNRKSVKETIENIKNYYPNSYIDYCSYEDNKKIEGIKLIQNIENNIFHKSLIGENFKLKTKNKIIIVENIEEAIQKDFDLIFHKNKGKIYLKGKKLTSKEIHSQNILTEIVTKLFEKQGEWISNKNFNKSSYSETKSVMGGRVVYPLRKLILEKLGKEIIFDIRGIGGDFEMKLDFGNLKVGILEKL